MHPLFTECITFKVGAGMVPTEQTTKLRVSIVCPKRHALTPKDTSLIRHFINSRSTVCFPCVNTDGSNSNLSGATSLKVHKIDIF